jgi:hypothetical protein
MANSNIPNRYIRVVSALAFIVAVVSSPIRPLSYGIGSARTGWLSPNVGARSTHSTPVSMTSVPSRPVRVKALPCERDDEEKLSTEAGLARPFTDLTPPPALKPAHDLSAFASDRAPHSLRC